jgi:hypothetical protein
MAERKRPPEDPLWEHVTHCSPCYQEFLQARGEVLEQRRARRRIRMVGIAAGIGAIGLTTALLVLRPGDQPQQPPPVANHEPASQVREQPPAEPALTTAVFNFNSVERGEAGGSDRADLQRIPRGRVALSIYLPPGNEPGRYDVRLLRTRADADALASFSGAASIRDGLAVLRIEPDLARFEPGTYVLAIRRTGESWRFQRFVLR